MAKKKRSGSKKKRSNNLLVIGGGLALAAAIIAGAAMAFAGGGDGAKRTSVRRPTPVIVTEMQTTVDVVDSAFEPGALKIPVGGTVTWEFKGDLPHNVTEDRDRWKSDTVSDGSFVQTFDEAGAFYYYCTLHHKMQGTIFVGDGAETTPTPAATPSAAAGTPTSVP